MNEWQVFCIVVSILGGVWGVVTGVSKVIKPLIEAITTLNLNVERLTSDLKELKSGNTESHKRIWDYLNEHDSVLNDHESRISHMEGK